MAKACYTLTAEELFIGTHTFEISKNRFHRFIQLFLNRKKLGTLEFNHKVRGTIEKLPTEVWLLIEKEREYPSSLLEKGKEELLTLRWSHFKHPSDPSFTKWVESDEKVLDLIKRGGALRPMMNHFLDYFQMEIIKKTLVEFKGDYCESIEKDRKLLSRTRYQIGPLSAASRSDRTLFERSNNSPKMFRLPCDHEDLQRDASNKFDQIGEMCGLETLKKSSEEERKRQYLVQDKWYALDNWTHDGRDPFLVEQRLRHSWTLFL